MYLKFEKIYNFKNVCAAELEFSPKLNCITGNNGEGKTNLLDSIYYLCMTKSYFSVSDTYVFKSGEQEFSLNGEFIKEDCTIDNISITARTPSEKHLKKNGKVLQRFSEHIGGYPVVMISPDDSNIINGSADMRRKFLNSILCQLDKLYLAAVQRYNTALANRNKLLKTGNVQPEVLEMLNMKLSNEAWYIFAKRNELIYNLSPLVQRYYAVLCSNGDKAVAEYSSQLYTHRNEGKDALKNLLENSFEKDCILKFTSCGVHRDDIDFTISGLPIRQCASQGEQKSFCVALKLAQYTIMKQAYGFAPILLLDDIFDKLDMNRVGNLLKMVASEDFGQIFISDCNFERTQQLVSSLRRKSRNFKVVNGLFEQIL